MHGLKTYIEKMKAFIQWNLTNPDTLGTEESVLIQSCQARVFMRNFTEIQQTVRTYGFPPIFTDALAPCSGPDSEVCAALHVLAGTLFAVILNKRPQTAAKM